MTLGELIAALKQLDPDKVVPLGFGNDRLREEFPQRPPDGGALGDWRRSLPPDFPLYDAHGDYIGRLTELHMDADHLSCLGCGQIGTPSTFSSTTGIYLCAERCVPAIRARLAAEPSE